MDLFSLARTGIRCLLNSFIDPGGFDPIAVGQDRTDGRAGRTEDATPFRIILMYWKAVH